MTNTTSLQNTRDFIVNYPPFDYGQEDHNAVIFAVELLSKRIIGDIAYDSSARTPHPCLPRTRLQLHEKVINWFYDRRRHQSVLWLNAPADIPTSVIVQTLSESLAHSGHLGAALFLSRAGRRNDIQRVLITVAFQLAVRVPSYGAFVADQITRNPGVLEGEIKEQFGMFITEPFGRRKIGEGEGPWGILLDGLDECESPDLQSEIVHFIGEFILNFPHTPLVWVITSRPQPYLEMAFTSKAMLLNHWSENIQSDSDRRDGSDHSDSDHMDSDERERVRERRRESRRRQREERLLFTGFETIRKQYSHLPSEWPSEIQMVKITNFVTTTSFPSNTLVRFIGDTDYADPISRLNQALSIIESSNDAITSHNRNAPSDALYTHILSSIPPDSLEVTKHVLGFFLCAPWRQLRSGSLKAMSTTLGLEKRVISQSLHGLRYMLLTYHSPIPVRILATLHSYPLLNRLVRAWCIHHSTFVFEGSFIDYLTADPARYPDDFLDSRYRNDVALTYFKFYLDAPWNSDWGRFISQIKRKTNFYHDLRVVATHCVYHLITGKFGKRPGWDPQLLDPQVRSECLDILSQINVIELYFDLYWAVDFTGWLFKLWDKFSDEFRNRELVKEVQLRDLTFDHLDCRRNKPVYVECVSPESPLFPWTLRKFKNDLRAYQRDLPTERVLICGSVPERRNALFFLEGPNYRIRYYCVPYPY